MLGHKLFQEMSLGRGFDTYATVRSPAGLERWFDAESLGRIITGVEAHRIETVYGVIDQVEPDVVINCIGIIKQLPEANNAAKAIAVNALLPHLVAEYCGRTNTRVIQISTDCVFSGSKGSYTESDIADASDLYGKTKHMGELSEYDNAITIRTSVIGHELKNHFSLIDWFMSQKQAVRGFTQAIYTGVPTIELSRIINKLIIPNTRLNGVYHLSSSPVSKYDLLKLVADIYGKRIDIIPCSDYRDNKSLISDRFQEATGYKAPPWRELVQSMYEDYIVTMKKDIGRYENYMS